MNGMGVKAPPHDILKVLAWKRHTKLKYLEELRSLEGYEELAEAVSKHHRDWVSDKITACLLYTSPSPRDS